MHLIDSPDELTEGVSRYRFSFEAVKALILTGRIISTMFRTH
jgi:hypothetical protein